MEKKALGKGLGALLPSSKVGQSAESVDIQRIRIEHIVPNRYQPRHIFTPEELAELAASIKESGVLQPIIVRRKGDGIYELIAGERRWRASKNGFKKRSSSSRPSTAASSGLIRRTPSGRIRSQ